MNPYREQEVRMILEYMGKITISVVGYDDMTIDETFDNFDEAKAAIEHYEQTADVYF
jgi:phage terminase large subunit-like protein